MGKFKTDYMGIHEQVYRRKKSAGEPGWSSIDEINLMINELDRIFSEFKVPDKSTILELGCGDGAPSLRLAEKGFDVFGIDISPIAIQWALDKNNEQNLKVNFTLGDVLNLPYSDESFDAVIDAHCLHCIIGEDRRIFLDNAYRVLKSSGYLIVMTMCGDPAEESTKKYFDPVSRNMIVDGIAGRYFGHPEDILREIQSAGFDIVKWKIEHDPADGQQDLIAVCRKI